MSQRLLPARTPSQLATPPDRRRWVPLAAVVWGACYGSLRVYWAVAGGPAPGPTDTDLLLVSGWGAVALCLAATAVAVAIPKVGWSLPVAVVGWCLSAALAVAGCVVLLDVVGLLLPGLGVEVSVVAAGSRAACMAGAALLAVEVLGYQRRWHGACPSCGSTPGTVRPTGPPRWAWVAAWAAVAGCLARIVAQVAVGWGDFAGELATTVAFEAGFLLAGTVLPLALVCRWGRVLPSWLPRLAGRRVPRWWVLGPGLALGVGMTAYFGATLAMLVVGTLTGSWDGGGFPLWFYWIAVPGYLVWGAGLLVAALAYRSMTRPTCRTCGR